MPVVSPPPPPKVRAIAYALMENGGRLVDGFYPLFSPNAGTRIEARSLKMPTSQDGPIVINSPARDSNRVFTSVVSMIMAFSS